jgi:predicted transcriptional regulator of viral defense system
MNTTSRLEQFNNASFVTKSTLSQVYGISENALSENIKRWLKKGLLIQLKNGVYVTREYFRSVSNRQTYIEFVANVLKNPSYLSTEYVLQKYSMLTESVFAVTSVSRKKTRQYHNALGTFQYATIKEELFTGFDTLVRDGLLIRQATKAKALFDFLYYRLWRSSNINKSLIESYRLNLLEFSKSDQIEFEIYIKRSEIKKFLSIPDIIRELIHDQSDASTGK